MDPFTIFITAISYFQSRRAKKKAEEAAKALEGVLLNKESNNEQIPVIYGKRRVGGTRVFMSSKDVSGGDANEYLYIALVLCEGEVNSISNIEIDDVAISDSRFNNLISYNVHLGTDSQTYDTLLAETAEWTGNHRLRGVAYIAFRLKWDQDAFGGLPNITAEVEGRKVYDPRNNTTAYSTNPALCLRDYLTNSRYGKGLPASAIDDTAFSTAANDCDQSVTFYTSGTYGKLFECNAVLDTDKTLFDNVNTLLLGMRGFLPYTQGKYALKIDKSASSVFDFDQQHILSGIKVQGETKEEKFNRIVVTFPNPDANWQPDNAVWPDAGSSEETSYLSEDGGIELVDEIELETTTNYYAARDLARILVLRSRNALRCSLIVTSEGFQVGIADVVTVTHPTPGFNQKPFQVEQIALNNDGTCSLQLVEYDTTIYTYDTAAEQQTYPDTDLPDIFSVAPVTNLTAVGATVSAADGAIVSAIDVSWTASNDSFVVSYQVTVTDSTGSTETVPVVGTSYRVTNLDSGLTYTISVRAVNSAGIRSNAVTVSGISPSVDTVAPSAPTNVSATGAMKAIVLAWTNPTASDFSHIEIKRSGTSIEGDAVYLDKTVSNTYSDGPFPLPTTRHYWIRSVDRTGNASAWVSAGSATSDILVPDDFTQGLIEFEFQDPIVQAEQLLNRINDESLALTALENLLATYNDGNEQRENFAQVSNKIQEEVTERQGAIASLKTELIALYNNNAAAIVTEQTARASGDNALASDIAALTSTVGSNTSAIATEQTARANGDTANANSITALTTTVNGHTASIATNLSSINGVKAQYTVTINNNGHVTGYGLVSDIIDGNATSQFKVAADQFVIAGSGSATDTAPFVVYTQDTSVTIDGQTFTIPAGAYIDSGTFNYLNANSIKTGTLEAGRIEIDGLSIDSGTDGLEIKDLGVKTAKIDDLGVTTGKIDDLAVQTLKIADQAVTIPSGAYTAGNVFSNSLYDSNSLSSYVTAQSVSFTSTGAPVAINWSFLATLVAGDTLQGANTGYAKIRVRLKRGTSIIQDLGNIAETVVEDTDTQMISGNYIHTGSAGSVSYILEVARQGYSAQVSKRSLTTMELKK